MREAWNQKLAKLFRNYNKAFRFCKIGKNCVSSSVRGVFLLPDLLDTENDYQNVSAVVPELQHFNIRVIAHCLLRVPKTPLCAATLTAAVCQEVDKHQHNKYGVVLGTMSDAEWNKWLERDGLSGRVIITADNIVIVVEFASNMAHEVCSRQFVRQLARQFPDPGAISCSGGSYRTIGPPLNKTITADETFGPGRYFRIPAYSRPITLVVEIGHSQPWHGPHGLWQKKEKCFMLNTVMVVILVHISKKGNKCQYEVWKRKAGTPATVTRLGTAPAPGYKRTSGPTVDFSTGAHQLSLSNRNCMGITILGHVGPLLAGGKIVFDLAEIRDEIQHGI
eukprot:TRINITY_DN3673_c0_g5_i2.p1 TRINITY_DN3673_c0_g5~~TRINITY_DN3673_c0_g5_i2.p1  ORF type:complete len:335 (+),score=45.38 TRINITY_DN3673_c0_g5_i2:131-1135(+)